MTSPWLFRQAKHFLETGELFRIPRSKNAGATYFATAAWRSPKTIPKDTRWRASWPVDGLLERACPVGRTLRAELQQVSSVAEVEGISERHIEWLNSDNALNQITKSAPGENIESNSLLRAKAFERVCF